MSNEEQALLEFLALVKKIQVSDFELSEYGKKKMAEAIVESDKFMRFIGMKK